MNVKQALAAAIAVVALAACGGAGTTTTGGAGQPTAAGAAPPTATAAQPTAAAKPTIAAAAPAAASTSAAAGSAPVAEAARKVNANTASLAELQGALEANGVANAARWAREVDEYRPYPTADASFAKLRQELAKYRPDQATVDKIVASLSL
jgi:hypothetical protein